MRKNNRLNARACVLLATSGAAGSLINENAQYNRISAPGKKQNANIILLREMKPKWPLASRAANRIAFQK